jgi:hypothetical protein
MPILWRTNEILTLVALALTIAGLIGLYRVYRTIKRGEVRLVRTHYRLPNYSYADDYVLAWGKAEKTRQAVLQRAARKAAVGR